MLDKMHWITGSTLDKIGEELQGALFRLLSWLPCWSRVTGFPFGVGFRTKGYPLALGFRLTCFGCAEWLACCVSGHCEGLPVGVMDTTDHRRRNSWQYS